VAVAQACPRDTEKNCINPSGDDGACGGSFMQRVMATYSPAVGRNRSNMSGGRCLDISYQNVRGLLIKSDEICINVCFLNFEIICLTETWLN
jgi:hypothetical protein